MDRNVSAHMHFREEVAQDGTTYFHLTLDKDQYTLQEVIQHVVTAIEEIGSVPGKNMSIIVHVSKSIEGENND